jgi:hypothetical protein
MPTFNLQTHVIKYVLGGLKKITVERSSKSLIEDQNENISVL